MQSQPEQESPSEEYLCDYLYIDAVRLSHFYGQLSEHGLVTQSKTTVKKSGKDVGMLKAGLPVFGGSMQQENLAEEALELQVDPAFQRPQQTLDALYEAGYIADGMDQCHLGGLALVEGLISVTDTRLMKEVWPFLGDMVAQKAAENIESPKEKQKVLTAAKKGFEQLVPIISKMPHSLQGSIATMSGFGWFTLKPDSLLVNSDDLIFKHGTDLSGMWKMLLLLDAYPDGQLAVDHGSFFNSEIEVSMRQMMAGVRTAFGRPADRYGVTPVMIFRTIKRDVPSAQA